MIIKKYFFAMFNPHASSELAANQSMLSAVVVNAINGILLMVIFLMPLGSFVPIPLMLLLAVLFGPFAGLVVSIVYTLIELWVSRKLGGKGTFYGLYRIFAWSFLPVGLAIVLCKLAIALFVTDGTLQQNESISMFAPSQVLFVNLCSFAILCFAIRNYCTNVISAHQFSKRKGALGMLISLVIFVIIPSWLIVLFLLIKQRVKKYRSKDCCSDDHGEKIVSVGVIRAGIALGLFYVALFSWIALYDEKPDPIMFKELSTPAPDIFRDDNVWLALLGFSSTTGGPPFVKEKERLRHLKAVMHRGGQNACVEAASANQKISRLSFKGKVPEIYVRKDNGIWEYVLAHNSEVDNFLQDNKELLWRYEKLYDYHQYTEPLDFGLCTPVPYFSPVRNIQKIKLMQIARIAQNGDFNGALISVQKDAEFWRFIARNSNTLISKLISFAMLYTDFKFVSELCAHHRLDTKQWKTVQAILRPFDQDETSLVKAFHGEVRLILLGLESSLQTEIKVPSGIYSLILKKNATRNRLYSSYQEQIELSEMTPQNYYEVITKNKISDVDPYVKLSFLYNPVGEILASIAKPNVSGYVEKKFNLEGLRKLALLKVLSGIENVASENMQQFLNTNKGDLGNPYTGAPMNWDSKKGNIFFKQPHEGKPVEMFM